MFSRTFLWNLYSRDLHAELDGVVALLMIRELGAISFNAFDVPRAGTLTAAAVKPAAESASISESFSSRGSSSL